MPITSASYQHLRSIWICPRWPTLWYRVLLPAKIHAYGFLHKFTSEITNWVIPEFKLKNSIAYLSRVTRENDHGGGLNSCGKFKCDSEGGKLIYLVTDLMGRTFSWGVVMISRTNLGWGGIDTWEWRGPVKCTRDERCVDCSLWGGGTVAGFVAGTFFFHFLTRAIIIYCHAQKLTYTWANYIWRSSIFIFSIIFTILSIPITILTFLLYQRNKIR